MENPDPFTTQYTNDDKDEDTLSLSDIPMYCDQTIEFQVEDQSMNDDYEQDFEFSSEMMTPCHDSSNPVVFCGKVIQVSSPNIQILRSKKQHRHCNRPRTCILRKVSILVSKTKSRWYLFMFGFGSSRFPKEMHIRDLRKRQTSVRSKFDSHGIQSQGLIWFLGCGGGGDNSEDDEELSKCHFQTWTSSRYLNKKML
ncbi:hypothetical protein L6452_05600 [Arctium lappa]|uniref:Uncharacterized protein n=1 Tax=Arctium lappa TaxID=4217 RepID=A0ACB9EHK3_ARCLA|nr:hypothetical protein L6452_05600 [Arctium lappa]